MLCAMGTGASLISQTSIASAMRARERSGLVNASTGADSEVAAPATSLEAALQAATAAAAVIFTGEVLSIEQTPGAAIVRWRVEDAVAGVTAGTVYEQKEWPGLWANGDARYQVGERALVLLHAPSVGGYSVPVADGIIPLRGDTVAGTLDLRWIAQQVRVTDAARLRPMLALRAAGGDFALRDAVLKRSATAASVGRGQGRPGLPSATGELGGVQMTLTPPPITPVDDAEAHVDGAMILGMLHAWRRPETTGR